MKDDTFLDVMVDVKQGRSDAFVEAAKQLGRFINELDLDADANNTLVDLTCKQVRVAERDAFLFGFGMGAKLMRDCGIDKEG